MRGTLAGRVTRWLSLPGHHQCECQMACSDATDGALDAKCIAAYIVANGLPPSLGSARGGVQPPADTLARITYMPRYEPPTSILRPKGHST